MRGTVLLLVFYVVCCRCLGSDASSRLTVGYALATDSNADPTFPIHARKVEMKSDVRTIISITTNPARYAMLGLNANLGEDTNDYPSIVLLCEPVTLDAYVIFTCVSAGECTAVEDLPDISLVDVDVKHLRTDVLVSNALFPNFSKHVYWLEENIPFDGLVVNPSLVQQKVWNTYRLCAKPLQESASYPIRFRRVSMADIEVSVTPGADKMALLGWRGARTDLFPADVVVCAPSRVPLCLDVTCTYGDACTTRDATILSKNTASDTSATFRRALSAGNVNLFLNFFMLIAWDLVDAPTNIDHLDASVAQSRGWHYSEIAMPRYSGAEATVATAVCIACLTILLILL